MATDPTETTLTDRLRDAAPTPSRRFDVDQARTRARRRRTVVAATSAVAVVAFGGAAIGGLLDGPLAPRDLPAVDAPDLPAPTDDPAPLPDGCAEARAEAEAAEVDPDTSASDAARLLDEAGAICDPLPPQEPYVAVPCSDAPELRRLAEVTALAPDRVLVFASCETALVPEGREVVAPDELSHLLFGLSREVDRDQASPRDVLDVYRDGLTDAEVDAGYSLVVPDLGPDALEVIDDGDGQVTVSITREALPDQISASAASAAYREQLAALLLQLPEVEGVSFAIDGSCEDFGMAVEAGACLPPVTRDGPVR